MKEVTLERNLMNVKNVGNLSVTPVPSEDIKRLTVKVLLNVNSIGKTSVGPHPYMVAINIRVT